MIIKTNVLKHGVVNMSVLDCKALQGEDGEFCDIHGVILGKNKNLLSPCCNSFIRAQVTQSCRVAISKKHGYVDCADNFSDPEIDKDTFFCEECASDLVLNYPDSEHKTVWLEKRIKLSLTK